MPLGWARLLVSLLVIGLSPTALGQITGEVTPADISSRATVDHLLLDHASMDQVRTQLRWSIFPVEGAETNRIGTPSGMVIPRTGTGIYLKCGGKNRILFPKNVAIGAHGFEVRTPNGKRFPAQILGAFPDPPFAVADVPNLPAKAVPIPIAKNSEVFAGRVGLTITQLGRKGYEVVSRVHIIENAEPPLAEFVITDIRNPNGFPLLSSTLELLAVPFRSWQVEKHTLAAPAELLKRACAKKDLALEKISPPSPFLEY